jgi:hypothetical protein
VDNFQEKIEKKMFKIILINKSTGMCNIVQDGWAVASFFSLSRQKSKQVTMEEDGEWCKGKQQREDRRRGIYDRRRVSDNQHRGEWVEWGNAGSERGVEDAMSDVGENHVVMQANACMCTTPGREAPNGDAVCRVSP